MLNTIDFSLYWNSKATVRTKNKLTLTFHLSFHRHISFPAMEAICTRPVLPFYRVKQRVCH